MALPLFVSLTFPISGKLFGGCSALGICHVNDLLRIAVGKKYNTVFKKWKLTIQAISPKSLSRDEGTFKGLGMLPNKQ